MEQRIGWNVITRKFDPRASKKVQLRLLEEAKKFLLGHDREDLAELLSKN